MELPAFQPATEHLIELPGIIVGAGPQSHDHLGVNRVIHVPQRDCVPLRAILVRKVVVNPGAGSARGRSLRGSDARIHLVTLELNELNGRQKANSPYVPKNGRLPQNRF
jgi:hypothetical protein